MVRARARSFMGGDELALREKLGLGIDSLGASA
jgi:hypothetical protein